jgi:nitroreductase
LAALYLDAWHDYVARPAARPHSLLPLASEVDRATALAARADAEAVSKPDGFAENLATVPALVVVTADLSVLAAVDRDLDRYHIAGGASIYPFVWQIILAARSRGLGGVMTTMATRNESAVQELLGVPEHHAIAAVVALGYPRREISRLRRRTVSEFATFDRFDGAAVTAPTKLSTES